MLRRIIFAVTAVVGFGANIAAAQGYSSEVKDLENRIEELGCSFLPTGTDAFPDYLWSLLSAYSGESIVQVAANVGYNGVEDFLSNGGQLNGRDDGADLLNTLVAGNTGATNRMRREIDRYGDALCPGLIKIDDVGFAEIVRLQINERAYWQPHAELAQAMLNAKTCGYVDVDGFFGPASRSVWGNSGLALSAGNLPTPGDIAALVDGTACGTPQMRDVADMFEHCHNELSYNEPEGQGSPAYEGFAEGLKASIHRKPIDATVRLKPIFRCASKALAWDNFITQGRVDAGVAAYGEIIRSLYLPDATPDEVAASARVVADLFDSEGNGDVAAQIAEAMIVEGVAGGAGDIAFAILANSDGNLSIDTLMALIARQDVSQETREKVVSLVDKYLAGVNEGLVDQHYETGEVATYSDGPLKLDAYVSMMGMDSTMSFIVRLDETPLLRERLLAGEHDYLSYAYATFILEGFTPTGRRPDRARAYFEAAANRGHAPSMFRLGLMSEHGLGGPVDRAKALRLYEAAAGKGETASALIMARKYEIGDGVAQDWQRAQAHYQTVVAGMIPASAAQAVFGQIASGSAFWSDGGPGDALLDEWAAEAFQDVPNDQYSSYGDDDWERKQHVNHYRAFAFELARNFSDAEGGQMLDLPQAARWLRVAGNFSYDWVPYRDYADRDTFDRGTAGEHLSRVLALRPELEAHPLEVQRLVEGDDPETLWRRGETASKVSARIADICAREHGNDDNIYDDDCLPYLERAAVGAIAPELIAEAFRLLRHYSDAEVREIRDYGDLLPNEKAREEGADWLIRRSPNYTWAMIDVLAFYGDYEGAEALARVAAGGDLNVSIPPLRRQIARSRELGTELPAIEAMLETLARGQSAAARDLLSTLQAPKVEAAVPDIETARLGFEAVSHLPTSRALANTARRLAPLEASVGNTARAIELELLAMKSDMSRHGASALNDGPMAARLAEVCTLTRSSERLFAYGAREVALTLAKQAVNTLQDMRRDISALPEQVQLCFRSQVESHYRWLADLFIAENRPDEASRVLEMLKSFESFEFANRARAMSAESFDKLPMMGQEQALMDVVARIEPPQTSLAARRLGLMRLANSRDLTDEEAAELEGLNVALAEAAIAREDTRDALIAAAAQVGRADANTRLNPGKSIKRYLRKGRPDTAAILQYVVLPDRMGLVLTTGTHQRVWGWNTLEGEAFEEARLNEMIGAFRETLKSPIEDPRPMGQRLHDVLLPPEVLAELEAAEVETLILSLDRQLRYLPMAALFDGEHWLASRYTLTHVTRSSLTASAETPSDAIAAFGVTQAHQGFSPLPAVADEVDMLVSEGGNDPGILSGSAQLDAGFTREALADSLIFSDELEDRLGILHLASHFKFGRSEADSFLLLGDGQNLTVQDIREGIGRDADLSEVALLTLSACETAYGETDADGRELESFASIAQHQGARAVMASLWPVADSSTAALMVAFYHRYTAGLPVAEALRGAQMALITGDPEATGNERRGFDLDATEDTPQPPILAGWEHPFFWAPFILLEGSV